MSDQRKPWSFLWAQGSFKAVIGEDKLGFATYFSNGEFELRCQVNKMYEAKYQ